MKTITVALAFAALTVLDGATAGPPVTLRRGVGPSGISPQSFGTPESADKLRKWLFPPSPSKAVPPPGASRFGPTTTPLDAALTVLDGTAAYAQAMTCELAAKAVWLPVTAQKYGGDEKEIAKRVVTAKVFRDRLSAPGAEKIGCDYRISYNDGSLASGIAFFRRISTGGWELDDWRSNDDLSRAYTPDDVPSAPDNGAPCQTQLTALNEWAQTADALASQAAGPQLPDFAAWNALRAVDANERYLEARMDLVACAKAHGLTVEWNR